MNYKMQTELRERIVLYFETSASEEWLPPQGLKSKGGE